MLKGEALDEISRRVRQHPELLELHREVTMQAQALVQDKPVGLDAIINLQHALQQIEPELEREMNLTSDTVQITLAGLAGNLELAHSAMELRSVQVALHQQLLNRIAELQMWIDSQHRTNR